jgi:hypothetical protein
VNPVLERTATDESSGREERVEDERRDGRLWWVALAVAMALATALLLRVGRDTSFWFDEWNFIILRRTWDAAALLDPHNEHLSLLPVLVYKLGFETVGLDSNLPYRLVAIALHLTCTGLLFVYARQRVGPALALALACVLLLAGAGWQDVLWPFQIGYLGSLASGLGALLLLDRRTRRGDVWAGVLLAVALSSSSLGIPLLLVCALDVACTPGWRRRWPIIVVPGLLYGLWYMFYGVSQDLNNSNLLAAPGYVAEAAAYAVGGVFGLSQEWGRPLALVVAAFLAWRLLVSAARPWRLVVLIALPLLFWGLTAVARANLGEPGASRYIYPGMLFLLLALAEAGRGLRLPSRRALILVALLVAGIVLSDVGLLRNGGAWLRERADGLEGGLAAVALAGAQHPDPNYVPSQDSPQLTLGQYRELQDQLAPPPADLTQESPITQKAADDGLLRLGAIGVRPGGGVKGVPAIESVDNLQAAPEGGCLKATDGEGILLVSVPAGGLSIQAETGDVEVAVRRFSELYPEGLLTSVPAGTTSTVVPRVDASPTPWRAQLKIAGEARVCGA